MQAAPWFPYALDLVGTFVFALSGAMAGVKNRLDLFGVLVLSFAAANTGGIIRDVLIGAVPPGAISDWHYLAVSMLAGLLTFYFPSKIRQEWNPFSYSTRRAWRSSRSRARPRRWRTASTR